MLQTTLCPFTCLIVSPVSFFDHLIGRNTAQETSVPPEPVIFEQDVRVGASINIILITCRTGFFNFSPCIFGHAFSQTMFNALFENKIMQFAQKAQS